MVNYEKDITSPAETCTLSDFVSAGINDDMTYKNFSIIEKKHNGVKYLDHCLIDDYIYELRRLCSLVSGITNRERIHYRYAPDLLAYDMYGSTQLDFIILSVNGMVSPLEFTLKGNLYLPKNSVLKSFLSMVYNAESKYLNKEYGDE